ncbi:hypothetical protein [Streptomyces sp. CA-251247]|uniref:hypothetical protein n=1 Tax=Streptomyces sp. CA-251247 TaxID=3240062 RepID=UPI003D92B412
MANSKKLIDAITQLRESWARVRTIDADICSLKADRRQVNKYIKEKSEPLKANQTLLGDLSTEFSRLLTSWNLPGSTRPSSTTTPTCRWSTDGPSRPCRLRGSSRP